MYADRCRCSRCERRKASLRLFDEARRVPSRVNQDSRALLAATDTPQDRMDATELARERAGGSRASDIELGDQLLSGKRPFIELARPMQGFVLPDSP